MAAAALGAAAIGAGGNMTSSLITTGGNIFTQAGINRTNLSITDKNNVAAGERQDTVNKTNTKIQKGINTSNEKIQTGVNSTNLTLQSMQDQNSIKLQGNTFSYNDKIRSENFGILDKDGLPRSFGILGSNGMSINDLPKQAFGAGGRNVDVSARPMRGFNFNQLVNAPANTFSKNLYTGSRNNNNTNGLNDATNFQNLRSSFNDPSARPPPDHMYN